MDKCWHESDDQRLCDGVVADLEHNMRIINPWNQAIVVAQSLIDDAWD